MIKRKRAYCAGDLEHIDDIIKKVFRKGRFGGSAQISKFRAQWEDIVGVDAALHSFPQKISDGKLYVKVDSPVWRQQLDMIKDEIGEKIIERFASEKISKVIMR